MNAKQLIPLCVCLAAGTIQLSAASMLPHFTLVNADAQVDDGQPWAGSVTDGSLLAESTFASAENPGGTFQNSTVQSSVSANLSTGHLSASSYTDLAAPATFANGQAYANIGDSFQVFDQNGPFNWTGGDEVSFSLNLSGQVTASLPESTFYVPILVNLNIYEPGTIGDPFGNWSDSELGSVSWFYRTGPGADFVQVTERNMVQGSIDGDVFFSDVVSGNNVSFYNPANTLEDGIDLFANFNPLGDFDWELQFFVGEQLASPGTLDVDLSHTLLLSYDGPAGTTTFSGSGFPGTQALDGGTTSVPDSGSSLCLFGIGLGGLFWFRRRSANRCIAI